MSVERETGYGFFENMHYFSSIFLIIVYRAETKYDVPSLNEMENSIDLTRPYNKVAIGKC